MRFFWCEVKPRLADVWLNVRVTQTKALLWELWARNRIGLFGTLFGVPLVLLAAQQVVYHWPGFRPGYGMAKILAVWSVAYLVMIFSYAEFSSKTLQTGFPRHVLKLPLPTVMLVAVPMISAIATVFVFVEILLLLTLEQPTKASDHFWVLVAVIIAISWMQTINWGLNRSPMRAALLVIIVFAASGAAVVSTLSVTAGPVMPYWVAASVLSLLAASGVCLASTSLARVRTGQIFGQTIFWSDFTIPGFALPEPLSDPRQAQFWFEWRVFGSALPIASVFFAGLLLLVHYLPGDSEDAVAGTSIVVGVFLYISAVVGFELAKSHIGANDHRMSGFAAIRPLTSVELAFAKLKVAAFSIGLSSYVVALPLLAVWMLGGVSERLVQAWALLCETHGLDGAIIAAVLAAGAVPVMAWVLCGNTLALGAFASQSINRRVAVIAMAIVMVGLAIAYKLSGMEQWPQFLLAHYPKVFGALALVLAMGFGFALRAFAQVAPLSLLAGRFTATGSVAIAALASTTVMDGVVGIPWGFIGLTVCLGLLTLYPWILTPVGVHHNRHR
ncbi:MAG: hypothetical protein AB8B96_18565 [Lysobacterales bacterium]